MVKLNDFDYEKLLNFQFLKKYVSTCSFEKLCDLFIYVAKFGIIRDVKYIFYFVGENMEIINKAFIVACENSHIQIMKFLLKNGADIHYQNDLPLIKVIEKGNVEAFVLLVEYGADIFADNGNLPIRCCKSGDYPEIIEELRKTGLDLLLKSKYSEMCEICLQNNHLNTLNYLDFRYK